MLMRLLIIIILIITWHSAFAQSMYSDSMFKRCPTFARLYENGDIELLNDPVFTDEKKARAFAEDASRIASELKALGPLPPDYQTIYERAVFASEFMKGDCYDLSSSKINPVVRLRDFVKIPPPAGFVYVRKYRSIKEMPPEIAYAFEQTSSSEGSAKGININGRYIALIESDYHDELEDILAHELVHAYITLVSPKDLPRWFQEGAAVYFSTGKESRFYIKTDDSKIVQQSIPEDYKRKLHSFQYIEKKVGKDKLYEFVRESVVTGNVDPRKALGIDPPAGSTPERKPVPVWIIVTVCTVVVIVVALWFFVHRDDDWA